MSQVKYCFPGIDVRGITGYVRKGALARVIGKGSDSSIEVKYHEDDEQDFGRIHRKDGIFDFEFVHPEDEQLQVVADKLDISNPISYKELPDGLDRLFVDVKIDYLIWSDESKQYILGVTKEKDGSLTHHVLHTHSRGTVKLIPKAEEPKKEFAIGDVVKFRQDKSLYDQKWYCNVPPVNTQIVTFSGPFADFGVTGHKNYTVKNKCSDADGKLWFDIGNHNWILQHVLLHDHEEDESSEGTFPIEGQCKSITKELEEYLRKTRTPEGDQSQREKAKAVCWNNKGYWYVSRSSSKYEYSIEFLSQFFTQKTEQPMATAGGGHAPQLFDYSPQSGFQLTLPPDMVAAALKQATETHMRESAKSIDAKKRELESLIHSRTEDLETSLVQSMEHKISCEFVEYKEKVIADHLKSQHVVVKLGDQPKYEFSLTDKHAELPKMISFLQLFKQAMIVGPSGSGKSTMAKQAAEVMDLRYGSFSCNLEASKSELIGFANIDGYVESSFLDFYENGGVFLVDEYDSMSPSIAVVLNAAFDRTGQIAVPNRRGKTIAKKHKDFYCILAGNTWGSGSVEYQGREMQDAAFLDRFKMCRIFIDYDAKLEKNIAGEYYDFFKEVRQYVNTKVDGENFSTRSMYDASMLLQNGFKKSDILNMMSEHWDEALRKDIFKQISVK